MSKPDRQSFCSACLPVGTCLSAVWMLVLLPFRLTHRHFVSQAPTEFQLLPFFQVVLSPLSPLQTFSILSFSVRRAKVMLKWVRGGMSCLLPPLFSAEEVATALFSFDLDQQLACCALPAMELIRCSATHQCTAKRNTS